MTAHNLLLHERSRQEQAKQLRFRKLFHIGRPVTVLSVALLAATAVIGSTINTMSYLDSISAAQPVPTTHRVTARRSANTSTLVLGSSLSSDLSGQVLGTSVIAPAPSTEAQINVAAMTSTVASLVNNLLNQYLSQGLLTGPAGPPGPSGLTPGFSGPNGMVQNGNGQTTSVIGGTPIVSYIPASQGNGNYTGGSLAGFTNLSGQNLVANTENVTGNLTVQGSSLFGSATFSGSASVAGTFSAATSTFSTLTVSGPATFTGSTTIAGLTVTGFNPGLTLGSVAFQGATGLSQDNSNYFYNPTTHSLGLGTSSPTSTLFVQGSGSNNPFVVASSTGTQLLTVLPNGNVGIGTTSPTQALAVNGNIISTGGITVGTTSLDPVNGLSTPNFSFNTFGNFLLRDWQSQIAKITSGSGGQAVIAWFGDSWTVNGNIIYPLRQYLQGRFGNAGFGYVEMAVHDAVTSGASRVTTGTWVDTNKIAGVTGLDAASANSSDTATPATKQVQTTATGFIIYWLGAAGGGSFTYSIDGGGATTVSTVGSGVQTTTISGLSNAYHALVLTVTVAGSAGVTLLGVDCQNTANGVRLNQIGNSGSQASDFLLADATSWESGLTTLAPNLVVLMFGINEMNAGTTPASQAASLTSLIARIRVALPNVDILLATPGDNGTVGTAYPMSAYTIAQSNLAVGQEVGFVDNLKVTGPYASANARGLYGNAAHINIYGGQLIANNMASYITGVNSSVTDTFSGSSVILSPLASGASPLKLYFPAATTNDTIKVEDLNMGQGYGQSYWQWTKTSATGRQLDLFHIQQNGVQANPITFTDNGQVTIASLNGNTLNLNIGMGASNSTTILQSKYSGWTNPMFALGANGLQSWGAGNAGAIDVGWGCAASRKLYIGNGTQGAYAWTLIVGNVGIGTTTPTLGPLTMASGAYVSAGGTWTNASDRNLKENFATLTPASILEKIDQLPVTEWNYKTEGPGVNHIGPVAQDFWAAFHLGNSSTSISTIDPAGVALLGIQALDQKLEALQGSLTGNATTTGELTVYNPGNFSGDSVGEAKILSGQTSVRITFTQPYAYQPIVT